MRKFLLAFVAAALSVAALAGCKLDVTPADNNADAKTQINGDATTNFNDVAVALGRYRSLGAVSDGNLAADACNWTLRGDTDGDGDLDVIAEGTTRTAVDLDPSADVTDFNDQDKAQEFRLDSQADVLDAKGCKTFIRVGD